MKEFLVAGAGGAAFFGMLSLLQLRNEDVLRRSYFFLFHGVAVSETFFSKLVRRLGVNKRRLKIRSSIPDFLDLLALGLSAGLNFSRSFQAAFDLTPAGSLRNELEQTRRVISMGGSLETALQDLAKRLGDDQLGGSFSLIFQSLKRGSPLQTVLFDQAASLRRIQMMALEKKAQTIGIRLLFPIMVFIFPTIFILLFGSLYLSLLKNGSLF